MSDFPSTVGEMLNKRRGVENRISTKSTEGYTFWSNSTDQLTDAVSQVQSVLDRYQVLAELNERLVSVGALKETGVTMEPFYPGSLPMTFSLSLLRDAETWLLPLTTRLEQHLTTQATNVSSAVRSHDTRVRNALATELAKLENQHKKRVNDAKEFGEEPPTLQSLLDAQETAKKRSATKLAVRVDKVGVRDVINKLRTFNRHLRDRRNVLIDSCNSTDVTPEVEKLNAFREEASTKLRSSESALPEYTADDENEVMSLAELELRTTELKDKISNAISYLTVVTWTKGQGAKNEAHVDSATENLSELCKNLTVLMRYRQVHHESMALRFTCFHPLTHLPLSVDGMVRLGFVEDHTAGFADPYSRKSRRKVSKYNNLTLCHELGRLFDDLSSVDSEVKDSKEVHETAVNESVSEKQESRTKSGAPMKTGELEDIAKSVRAASEKTWHVAPNLDKALERVKELKDRVDSLQSAQRKSANANIKVYVPKPASMTWATHGDGLDGW
jgi:hypothetical protein